MYESPINIIFQNIQEQIAIQTERDILEIVRKCGIDVDKDELVKALNYDRNQYNKGYVDGVNGVLDKIRTRIEKLHKMCDKDDLNMLKQYSTFGMVLDILDEYKAESEGAE